MDRDVPNDRSALRTLSVLLLTASLACGDAASPTGRGSDDSSTDEMGATSSDESDADESEADESEADDGEADDDADNEADDSEADDEDGSGGASESDGEECGTVLYATVRDFRADHPDFQNPDFQNNEAFEGIVEARLGDDKKPVYASAGATRETTGPAEFAQWYNDVDGVNQTFKVEIPLVDDGSGKFIYDNDYFFPIDGQGFGSEAQDNMDRPRNFHFTTEIHTEFEYRGGEVFTFKGDDDVWVFINGKLAIDLGGLHRRIEQSVDLDEAAEQLGITTGESYSMDIFHAERYAIDSNFRIETTIDCLRPVVVL